MFFFLPVLLIILWPLEFILWPTEPPWPAAWKPQITCHFIPNHNHALKSSSLCLLTAEGVHVNFDHDWRPERENFVWRAAAERHSSSRGEVRKGRVKMRLLNFPKERQIGQTISHLPSAGSRHRQVEWVQYRGMKYSATKSLLSIPTIQVSEEVVLVRAYVCDCRYTDELYTSCVGEEYGA